MQVKVSTVFKKFLQKSIPEYKFYILEISPDHYDNIADSEAYENGVDFIPARNAMKVLQVVYPAEYYAMDRYLTTKNLNAIFRRSDRTAEGFIKAIREEIEI